MFSEGFGYWFFYHVNFGFKVNTLIQGKEVNCSNSSLIKFNKSYKNKFIMQQKLQAYNLIERIGIGGMGIVWKASHDYRTELFAVKSLSPQFVHDTEFRKRFINEAAILNKLNHKNIVRITDFIEEPEGLHLIMEYVEGRTLDKIIGKEVGPIPYEKALPIFTQILEGINYAHKQGVIHRDLKPSNIIVTPENEIKITDFGIARMEGQALHTKTGTKMGTISYMSPEQIKGENVDEQSDIYSLGITLYVMLAGKLPFDTTENTSDFIIMNKIINEPIKDPREYYPYIPEWLVEIVYKAIEKDKRKRIKNIEEFLILLKNQKDEIKNEDKITKDIISEHQKIITKNVNNNIIKPTENKKNKKRVYFFSSLLLIILSTILFYNYDKTKNINDQRNIDNKENIVPELKTTKTKDYDMVYVEGGTFMMGSDEGEADEKPVHSVTVNSFYISKYEVTQKEWISIMGNNPSYFKGDNLPVEKVSWNDIQEFIKKLNQKTGKNYRLPTEAEWEYAARGGNKSRGYEYSGSDNIDEIAWYWNNSEEGTKPVGTKKSNELGIYDMTGNVWEWCNDWYDENYYRNSPSGPYIGEYRVLRGSSWNVNDDYSRSANRGRNHPNNRNGDAGFRLVKD